MVIKNIVLHLVWEKMNPGEIWGVAPFFSLLLYFHLFLLDLRVLILTLFPCSQLDTVYHRLHLSVITYLLFNMNLKWDRQACVGILALLPSIRVLQKNITNRICTYICVGVCIYVHMCVYTSPHTYIHRIGSCDCGDWEVPRSAGRVRTFRPRRANGVAPMWRPAGSRLRKREVSVQIWR